MDPERHVALSNLYTDLEIELRLRPCGFNNNKFLTSKRIYWYYWHLQIESWDRKVTGGKNAEIEPESKVVEEGTRSRSKQFILSPRVRPHLDLLKFEYSAVQRCLQI
jgi:hypothetical protein